MFLAEKQYGSARLKQVFDALILNEADKLPKVARFLDVSERTVTNWLSGKTEPPRAVVYALWHESHIGRATTAAFSEQGAHLWRTYAKSAESKIQRLEAKIDALNAEIESLKRINAAAEMFPVAVNEPFFSRY